jgi:hypothetical protein
MDYCAGLACKPAQEASFINDPFITTLFSATMMGTEFYFTLQLPHVSEQTSNAS